MALGTNYLNTPYHLRKLTDAFEELYPIDGINPAVNNNTIYPYVSAYQLGIALIHPFMDGVGRTSEDAMYSLWHRRPDLRHTIRYLSYDGLRESKEVYMQIQIINQAAKALVQMSGAGMGLIPNDVAKIGSYNSLLSLASNRLNLTQEIVRNAYLMELDAWMVNFITTVQDGRILKNSTVKLMARNLAAASPTYFLRNGQTLISLE